MFMVVVVLEGALGLRLVVLLSRVTGSDQLRSVSITKTFRSGRVVRAV